jgi:hypothetical protein
MTVVTASQGRDGPARPPLLAIDLGAANVKMAWIKDGRIVDSSQRDVSMPAVAACHGGDLSVGKDALALSELQPAAVLLNVREWLGLVPSVRLGGQEVQISEAVTALYRAAAQVTLHTTDNLAAVIVHPAPWPRRRVEALTAAARAASLDVVRTVPDAVGVAAAGPRDGDVLVIDVGSSLTVSVVDAKADPPLVLWSRSSVGAGGEAIAQAIRQVTRVPASRARDLARGAEQTANEPPVDWAAVRRHLEDGVAAASRLVNEVLVRSNRDASTISRVYVTGGASVAPFVRDAVHRRFGSDKVSELSGPSASAAYGALRLTRPDLRPERVPGPYAGQSGEEKNVWDAPAPANGAARVVVESKGDDGSQATRSVRGIALDASQPSPDDAAEPGSVDMNTWNRPPSDEPEEREPVATGDEEAARRRRRRRQVMLLVGTVILLALLVGAALVALAAGDGASGGPSGSGTPSAASMPALQAMLARL